MWVNIFHGGFDGWLPRVIHSWTMIHNYLWVDKCGQWRTSWLSVVNKYRDWTDMKKYMFCNKSGMLADFRRGSPLIEVVAICPDWFESWPRKNGMIPKPIWVRVTNGTRWSTNQSQQNILHTPMWPLPSDNFRCKQQNVDRTNKRGETMRQSWLCDNKSYVSIVLNGVCYDAMCHNALLSFWLVATRPAEPLTLTQAWGVIFHSWPFHWKSEKKKTIKKGNVTLYAPTSQLDGFKVLFFIFRSLVWILASQLVVWKNQQSHCQTMVPLT